jgi:hypothetical protein
MSLRSIVIAGCVAALSSVVAGCGVDDVQLNGKLFDAIGMNTSSVKKAPKMASRPSLLVPPDMARLPDPGTGKAGEADIAEVKDYDASRQLSQADLEKQQTAYCEKHYENAKIHGDQDAVLAQGPLGPCQRSAMSIMKNINGDEQ